MQRRHIYTASSTLPPLRLPPGSRNCYNRRGLNKRLDDAENVDYGRVLVTYQDRLTRFGFSYLECLFDQYGVEIRVINQETDKAAHEELVDDLLQLVVSFVSDLYRMRSSKPKRIVETVGTEVETNE